jgi:hypothetical protein
VHLSLLRLEFLSGFLPSFFRFTNCYSWIDLSFLVLWIFSYGFLKSELNMFLCKIRQ